MSKVIVHYFTGTGKTEHAVKGYFLITGLR